MEQVVITVELHESIMKCRQELMFVVAEPKEKSCHGILTVRKVFDIDNERMDLVRNLRKRQAPASSVVVMNERKGRRFECGFCEYESRAQYITLPAFTKKASGLRNVIFAHSKLSILLI